jgi:hypothetical protein
MGGDENATMNREEIEKIYSQAVQRVLERVQQGREEEQKRNEERQMRQNAEAARAAEKVEPPHRATSVAPPIPQHRATHGGSWEDRIRNEIEDEVRRRVGDQMRNSRNQMG